MGLSEVSAGLSEVSAGRGAKSIAKMDGGQWLDCPSGSATEYGSYYMGSMWACCQATSQLDYVSTYHRCVTIVSTAT